MKAAAKAAGLKVMVGCMIATSLSLAPALMLAKDRVPGVIYDGSRMAAGPAELWG